MAAHQVVQLRDDIIIRAARLFATRLQTAVAILAKAGHHIRQVFSTTRWKP